MFSWVGRWPRIALIGVGVWTLLLAGSGAFAWRLYHLDPHPTVDTVAEMNARVRRDQPAGDNAWDALSDIIVNDLGLSPPNYGRRFRRLGQFARDVTILAGPWGAMDRAPYVGVLGDFRPTLDAMADAVDRPVFAKPYVHAGDALTGEQDAEARHPFWMILLPELNPLRRLGTLNAFALRAAAETSDWDTATRRFRAGLRLGRGLTRQSSLIEGLVGAALIYETVNEAARLTNEHDIPVSVARDWIGEIEGLHYVSRDVILRGLETESTGIFDAVQFLFSDDGAGSGVALGVDTDIIGLNGGGAPAALSDLGRASNLVAPFLFFSRRATEAEITAHFDRLMGAVDLPPAERSDAVRAIDADAQTSMKTMAGLILPAFRGGIDTFAGADSALAGLRVMLLLEIEHAQTGAWPESIVEALGDAPIDPVSGEPFLYELLTDDPAGRAYELRVPWVDADSPLSVINPPREALPGTLPTPPVPSADLLVPE